MLLGRRLSSRRVAARPDERERGNEKLARRVISLCKVIGEFARVGA